MNKKAILIIIIITLVVIVITMWLGIVMNFSDIILAALIEGFLGIIAVILQIVFNKMKSGNTIDIQGATKIGQVTGGNKLNNVNLEKTKRAGNTIVIKGNGAEIDGVTGGDEINN